MCAILCVAGGKGALVDRAPGARVPKPRSATSEALAEVSKQIAQQVAALLCYLDAILARLPWRSASEAFLASGICCRPS